MHKNGYAKVDTSCDTGKHTLLIISLVIDNVSPMRSGAWLLMKCVYTHYVFEQ